ncbi:MAG TPA: hypothetical protein VGM93_07010, partial [Acidimicrobiales bacterium]
VVLNCYGGGGAYWGPVTDHLGRLAAAAGDLDAARLDFEDAIAAAEAMGAHHYADRTRDALNGSLQRL